MLHELPLLRDKSDYVVDKIVIIQIGTVDRDICRVDIGNEIGIKIAIAAHDHIIRKT